MKMTKLKYDNLTQKINSYLRPLLFGLGLTAFLVCLSPTLFAFSVGDVISKEMEEKLEKTIFLDLRDINVVDVFKFIAVQGNVNVVTSKNVQGRSTLVLKNVKIRDALDILVISNQLAYEVRENIIYIMTEDEYTQTRGKSFNDKRKVLTRTLIYAKPTYVVTTLQAIQSALGKVVVDEDTGTVVMIDTAEKLMQMNALLDQLEHKLETKVISLQYANAKDVEAQLKPILDAKGVGSIMADERSNQIVLSAYPGRMDSILPTVTALDKQTKAVLIEARILQITLNPKFDYGINWEKLFQDKNGLNFKGSFPIQTTASGVSDTSFGKVAVGHVEDGDLVSDIRFLKQVLNTKILASPRLMILNKQESKINIGDRLPYVVTTSTGTGTNVSVSEDIRFIDVGINLVVTPVINDNGFITMKIRPEISSRTGDLTTPTDNKIPQVNTTYIETSVIVKDGMTVILGGLRRDEATSDDRGVPYLMDTPWIGGLFKSRNDSIRRTEILVLITPKIVTGEKDVLDEPIKIKTDPLPSSRNVFVPMQQAVTVASAGDSPASVMNQQGGAA